MNYEPEMENDRYNIARDMMFERNAIEVMVMLMFIKLGRVC